MIPLHTFGRTGHDSTRVIFGAAALAAMRQDRADLVLDQIRRAGVNHIDTAASYGDSELRLAPFLALHRGEYFVATKTAERTGDLARRELERSLGRLGVDRVDMIQLHNLVEPDEWEIAHGRGGAVEAMVAARDEGLVDFIGVTGHGTRIAEMHRTSLERFDFDSVLLPYNYPLMRDDAYRSGFEALAAKCSEDNVAIQTIKSSAHRRWHPDDAGPRFSWYRPLPPGDALARAITFVLGRPGLFLNTSSDATLLAATLSEADRQCSLPSPADLEQDMVTLGMQPLFDGANRERI